MLGLVLNFVNDVGKEFIASYNCPLGVTEVVLANVMHGNSDTGGSHPLMFCNHVR